VNEDAKRVDERTRKEAFVTVYASFIMEAPVLFTVVARTDRILKNTARNSNLGTNRIDVRAV